jgi:hypothetical protein
VLGEPWPGATLAARRLETEAAARGLGADAERQERARTYDRWLAELTRDAETAEKQAARASRAASGG